MRPVGESATVEDYRDFGERQAGDSPCLTAWALGVADDPEVVALLETLPAGKRQPNLVFAAARWHGAGPGGYDELRRVLRGRWPEVRATVLARATQTNEVGRCATLLPVLAGLPGPLALIEVGASAGLCLYPDRYSYRWSGERGPVSLDPAPAAPSPVLLECRVHGDPPLPSVMPRVVSRSGVDLHPLDVRDEDAMAWLRTLVWPEQEERRRRLTAAVALVRADPPSLRTGDLLDEVAALVDEVPADVTPVVLHSAVLAYLSGPDRACFVEQVGRLRGHWVSNEGPEVVPGLRLAPPAPTGIAAFALAVDGRQVAWTHGHGAALWWI